MSGDAAWIKPAWPAPANVKALVTTRKGGVSKGGYRDMNLGLHVGDDPQLVETNRQRLAAMLDLPRDSFCWLQQVHGTHVVRAETGAGQTADACYTRTPERVCVVMTADCLPVLFCNRVGSQVACAHAGWRGLLDGVLEQTLATFGEDDTVLAWLGPAIGPDAFEVGGEVREQFCARDDAAEAAFQSCGSGKYLADLYLLARQRLKAVGVNAIYGGGHCTFTESDLFFSYRRQGTESGRMASLIWLSS
ncbi:MAG: peptidoglycan editing factor PgeF [Oleiphilaceae bacterium]|nr:peptidoglycan editing factor PgeF [Oleiphilaceae bacterium]